MNDPNAKPHYPGEPRVSIDLDDIERRLRESLEPVAVPGPAPVAPPAPAPAHDPLAELARLVGGAQDPFSKVFAPAPGLNAPPPSSRPMPPLEPPPLVAPSVYAPTYAAPEPAYAHEPAYAAQPAYAQEPAYAPEPVAPAYGQYAQPAYGEPQQQQGYAPWAPDQQQGAYDQYGYEEEPPRRTSRAKLLIGAAVVIAAGGMAAAFALRGSGTMGDAPTIMANSGPVKVQPAQPAADNSKPNISVLNRGGNTPSDSKVVQSEEQPVDLGTAARSAGPRPQRTGEAGAPVTLAPPPPPPVANSLFAEPKKVKAVAVRPDGTIIDPNAPAQPPAAPAAAPAPAAAAPKPAAAPAPAGKPMDIAGLVAATANNEPPKAAARAADPKPAAAAAAPAPAPAPTPAPRPAAATPAAPAPVATATATAGTYAVQLVGTTSQDEAKAALDRVNTRFRGELGSYRPTIVKAEDGGRTVFRVRVINLSSDDANRLCAKLKASGGTCFVARS